MGKIDPLVAWIQQSPVQALIAGVILLVFCALLVAFMRQQRRLVAVQTQLKRLSSDIRRLEIAHEGLLVRFMNLPRRSNVPNGSSSDMLQEKTLCAVSASERKISATSADCIVRSSFYSGDAFGATT